MNLTFDSDQQTFPDGSNFDSDIDARTIGNQEISNYQETINDLKKQNMILKAQFEQAVTVAKKVDGVHEENFKLSNQVRSLQLENENLQCRNQILLHNNEELESQLSSYKSTFAQQVLQATSDKELEVSKAQKLCNGKIDTLLIRINKSEELKEQSLLEVKMLRSKIDRLLQSANDYFKLKFEEIDNFIDFLNQTACIPSNNVECDPIPLSPPPKPIKSKSDKLKIKTLKNQCKKFASEINGLQNKILENESAHSKEISAYQNEVQKLKEELENTQTENKETICNLKSKNQELKNKFIKLRQDAVEIQAQYLASQNASKIQYKETEVKTSTEDQKNKINSMKEKLEIYRDEKEKLNKQLNELKSELKRVEESKNDLASKLKAANDAKTSLQMTIDQNEIEKQASEAVRKETLEELKALRERLKIKESKKPKQESIDKLKDEIIRLENVVKSKTDEINSLNIQVENGAIERASNHSKCEKLTNENKELKDKISALNDELNELNDRLEMKPEIRAEDVMPESSFCCKEFDSSLSQKIEQVAFNQYLSPQSKLAKIYNIIHVHYNGILKENESKLSHMTEHLEVVKKQINSFLVDISIGLSFNALTFDDFMYQGGQKIIEKAVDSFKNVDEMRRKNSQLFSIVSQIYNELDLQTNVDVYSQTQYLSQNIATHFNEFKLIQSKYKEMKKKNKIITKTYTNKIKKLEENVNTLKKQAEEKDKENEKMRKKNEEQRKQSEKSKHELIKMNENMKDKEEKTFEEHQNQLDEMCKKHEIEKNELTRNLNEMKEENEKMKEAILKKEAVVNRMKTMIHKHQDEKKKQEEKFDIYKHEKEEEIEGMKEDKNNEKKELVKRFEATIQELNLRCESQRKELSELESKLEKKSGKYEYIKNALIELKRSYQQLENEKKTLQDQITRDKIISETTLKNEIMTVESKYQQKVDDATLKIEAEKRRLISMAVDEFRTFTNVSKSLDERCFKSLLNRIRSELEKLSKTDSNIRRMTGAMPYQTTDDAVAKLIH